MFFDSTDSSSIENDNESQIQSEIIEEEKSNSNGKEKAHDQNPIEHLTICDENNESLAKVHKILPEKKQSKSSVSKLLERVTNKKFQGLHTNGFDIPRFDILI